jgi:hypothetical protein
VLAESASARRATKVEPMRSPDQRKVQRELPIIRDNSNYFIDRAYNKLRIIEVQVVERSHLFVAHT